MGRLPRGDQRAVRHRQEGAPRARPGQPAQYGQRFAYLIPTNLYGPGDKFHPRVSHVIPALIKKCVEAVEAGDGQVDVWGTGRPAASTCTSTTPPRPSSSPPSARRRSEPVNLGTDHEVTIRETVETIARLVGFDRRAALGPHQARRSTAPARRRAAGPSSCSAGGAHMPFEDGLRRTIDWYLANRDEAERDRRLTSANDQSSAATMPAVERGRPVGGGQGVDRLVGVEPARVGHDPQHGARRTISGWRPAAASRPPKASR